MTNLLKKLAKRKISPNVYRELPESAGIYVFFKDQSPIYIGKAINLKRRVSSYFDLDLEVKTARMMKAAQELSFVQVSSELEALLLEARLIRAYMPKYNIAAKDDKHPLYIQITNEIYPRITTARKIAENQKNLAFYGPFPSSKNVRSVLRMLRRIFPYSDHKLGKRGCLYSHIGLCNPCPNEIVLSTKRGENLVAKVLRVRYLKNIRSIKSILDGHIDKVAKNLNKDMNNASKSEDYETAKQIRDQIERIKYITRPQMPTEFYIQNPNLYEDVKNRELEELNKILNSYFIKLKSLSRIECFDVAHLAGNSATASMVTFVKAEPDKNLYRHFRIRQKKADSDTDSLKEVIARRLKHVGDWGIPDLIIVDGGTPQVNAFSKILYSNKVNIPVVGIAKNPDRLIIGKHKIKLQGPSLHLVSRIRDEAHRFAGRYHHTLVLKALIHENL